MKTPFLRQGEAAMQQSWSQKRLNRLAQRFWDKVKRGKKSECWEWQGTKTPGGYGVISSTPIAKLALAHRLSWFLTYSEDPGVSCVCHSCDNTGCVNPNHLFLGSRRDNNKDSTKKLRRSKKLTAERVSDMRMLYETGRYTMIELAQFYNISQPNVSLIVSGKSWGHLLEE